MGTNHASQRTGCDQGKRLIRYLPVCGSCVLALLIALAVLNIAQGQQVHRNGFETREPAWLKGPADAVFQEAIHDTTEQTAHSGQLSEHLQFNAEPGSFIHYHYPTARAPLGEELASRVWIKANRPGVQLLGRLVLPKERNPNNLTEPLTALLRGDAYQLVGRWQALELRRPVKLANEQQQLMRAELKRDVDFSDAYIDRLVLNVYSGPGMTEVWIDDLEIGPVLETKQPPQPRSRPPEPDTSTVPPGPRPAVPEARHAVVELNQDRLTVNNKRFFVRAIRHSNTPLTTLREAGFNTVWLDADTAPEVIEEAVRLGFWLVPTLQPHANDPQFVSSSEALSRTMARFKDSDAVLFWDLGGGKTSEDAGAVGRTAQMVRSIDPQHPVGADVWDGFQPYSRHLQMLGAHRWPLLTTLELPQYRDWLNQRRLLARPGTYMWTWVQTHLPEWHTALVYDRPGAKKESFTEPIGPQAEQVRLMTYVALSAGCQGLGFWSDRFLADSHQGRDRLLTLALLNQEIQMLEPLLLSTVEPPTWIDTSSPHVKAAVLRTELGVLVLPMWMGTGSQFVPGQGAVAQLSIIVPQVPACEQAWEVSPGDVRSLKLQRVAGGTKLTLPEFGLTTAIVFTADNSPSGLLVRFQEQARKTRPQAAKWMYDLAAVESEKVLKVESELEKGGHVLPDGQALQDNARERLQAAKQFLDNNDYRQAYWEAQRALRPLRIVMRAQWEAAVKPMETPVASVYALSYYTLPLHYDFMRQVQRVRAGANVLPDGDFEAKPDNTPTAWLPQEVTLDDVELAAWRVADEPREGQRCLKLEIKPKNAQLPPGALERTFLAINSPAVKLQPGTLVRISGWVRIPKAITASADGALLFDNAGGEPLAVRLTGATPWKKVTFYRQVPESGSINVTVALTGIGAAYFDDVRIEPMTGSASWNRPPAR